MIIERKSQITASQFFYCRIAPKKGSYIKEQFCKKKNTIALAQGNTPLLF